MLLLLLHRFRSPGYPAEVDQVHRRNIVGGAAAANGAAAQCQGREQARGGPNAAQSRRGVDQETGHRNFQSKPPDNSLVPGVDGEGVAAALMAQHLHSLLKHRILAVQNEKGQHGAELFHGIGPGRSGLLLPGHEDLGVLGHGEARLFRQINGAFAHNFRV